MKQCKWMWMVMVGLWSVLPLPAADWSNYLGPNRNNVAAAAGLARTWPAGGPKVVWQCRVGVGFSGPAIAGNDVYLLDRVDNARDVLRCLAFDTGKERWSCAYDAPGKFSYNGSRGTPAVDKEFVFTVGPLGQMTCISRSEKKKVWGVNLLSDFGAKRPTWVVSQSPLLYRDMVIAAPQGSKAGAVAFRRKSGEIAWQSRPVPGPMSYASPMLATLGGTDQVLVLSGQKKSTTLTGIDAGTGAILWTYKGGWQCRVPIVTPVIIGDGRIFLTGGYEAGSVMLRVTKKNGAFTVKELFRTQVCGSQIQQPLLYKGYLYINSNDNKRRDGFVCMDLNGGLKWKTGLKPNYERGPLLMLSGLIYALHGKNGKLALIDASPERFIPLAEARVFTPRKGRPSGRQAWAPMAFARGRLLLRDQGMLKCLDVAGSAP